MTVAEVYSAETFSARAQNRLHRVAPIADGQLHDHAGPSDFLLNPGHDRQEFLGGGQMPREAAVLVPIRNVDGEAMVILTQRPDTMRSHAGQIAFPGGRRDDGDNGALDTALREAEEEIGLERGHVNVLGFLDCYLTGTGYRVSPVVGIVPPTFVPIPEPGEVADVFEVPLGFLMDPINHHLHARDIGGRTRRFIAMPFGERYIWGATAGMLKNLYDRVYG